MSRRTYTQEELALMRRRNNPNNEPTGPYTGRCSECGSKDLEDDNTNYSCGCCGYYQFS